MAAENTLVALSHDVPPGWLWGDNSVTLPGACIGTISLLAHLCCICFRAGAVRSQLPLRNHCSLAEEPTFEPAPPPPFPIYLAKAMNPESTEVPGRIRVQRRNVPLRSNNRGGVPGGDWQRKRQRPFTAQNGCSPFQKSAVGARSQSG